MSPDQNAQIGLSLKHFCLTFQWNSPPGDSPPYVNKKTGLRPATIHTLTIQQRKSLRVDQFPPLLPLCLGPNFSILRLSFESEQPDQNIIV